MAKPTFPVVNRYRKESRYILAALTDRKKMSLVKASASIEIPLTVLR